MSLQDTKINKINRAIIDQLSITFSGPWKTRSIGLISLLLGFYFSSSLISYLIDENKNRLLVLIILLFIIEFLIRFRSKLFLINDYRYHWIFIDNVRIGTTYAIVLEAFKLGS